MFKFLSIRRNVNAIAKTGKHVSSRKPVIIIDQLNASVDGLDVEKLSVANVVVMKLSEAKIDDSPSKCKLKHA